LLGFTRDKIPSASTLHEVFKPPDVRVFLRALSRWLQDQCDGEIVVAIDGKGLRQIRSSAEWNKKKCPANSGAFRSPVSLPIGPTPSAT